MRARGKAKKSFPSSGWHRVQALIRTPAPAVAPAPAAKPAEKGAIPTTAAPGGGDGTVWVNTKSKVYHCEGSVDGHLHLPVHVFMPLAAKVVAQKLIGSWFVHCKAQACHLAGDQVNAQFQIRQAESVHEIDRCELQDHRLARLDLKQVEGRP